MLAFCSQKASLTASGTNAKRNTRFSCSHSNKETFLVHRRVLLLRVRLLLNAGHFPTFCPVHGHKFGVRCGMSGKRCHFYFPFHQTGVPSPPSGISIAGHRPQKNSNRLSYSRSGAQHGISLGLTLQWSFVHSPGRQSSEPPIKFSRELPAPLKDASSDVLRHFWKDIVFLRFTKEFYDESHNLLQSRLEQQWTSA